MNNRVFKFSMLCVVALSLSLNATAIDTPIAPATMKTMLGRGFDESWAEFNKNIQGYGIDEVLARKAKGFKNARIRTKLPADATLFSYLDRIVTDCLNNDIIPIIAHSATEYELSPTYENMKADSIWWATVADHFKNTSHKLLFDINIEWSDIGGKDAAGVNNYYAHITPGIRATNPTRILIYSPIKLSSPEYLSLMVIPSSAGSYVMAEWHLYAAGPSADPTSPRYWTTGTAAEKKVITDEINIGAAWEKKTGIPCWIGAWMAGNYNNGNNYSPTEQANFARFMVSEFARIGIPWSINAGDNYYDYTNNKWIDNMLEVLDVLSPISNPANAVEQTPYYPTVRIIKNCISFDNASRKEIRIYNTQGACIFSTETNNLSQIIPITPAMKGVYLVKISTEGHNIYSKKHLLEVN